jgi:GNAT superfamily N-acetyltransferase
MKIELVHSDEQRLQCFEVLKELRPSIVRERFLEDLARMAKEGFALAAVWDSDPASGDRGRQAEGDSSERIETVRAVAGFRPMEMFSTGPILYVDDLVTASAHRGKKYGAALLAFLNEHAKSLGCKFLELDSGMQRLDAHRFYRREGLEEVALHFSKPTGMGPRWKQQD